MKILPGFHHVSEWCSCCGWKPPLPDVRGLLSCWWHAVPIARLLPVPRGLSADNRQSLYYKGVLNGENPSVGLVNIGEEAEKGNDLTKETFKLLSEEKLNFIGNIEPRDITKGDVNVIVCDGFAGNTILKMYEGTASTIMKVIKEEVMASGIVSKIGAVLLKPVFNNIAKRFDYKEYGGAPFLGVDGICIKAHGSSDARAFKSAIKQAKMFYDNKVLDKIKENI